MDKHSSLLRNLVTNRQRKRQAIAKQSQVALEMLIPACDKVLNVCLSLIDRASETPFERAHPLSPGMFLVAQFLQGVDITRKTILIGGYHQAANLLKQETEILDAMHEIRAGSRMDKRTTKFKGEMQKLGRKYGELNKIAHPTTADVVELFSAKIEGNDVDPTLDIQFNEKLCRDFFGYHSLLVSIFSQELREIMIGTIGIDLTNEEEGLVINAIKTLVNEGAFTIH